MKDIRNGYLVKRRLEDESKRHESFTLQVIGLLMPLIKNPQSWEQEEEFNSLKKPTSHLRIYFNQLVTPVTFIEPVATWEILDSTILKVGGIRIKDWCVKDGCRGMEEFALYLINDAAEGDERNRYIKISYFEKPTRGRDDLLTGPTQISIDSPYFFPQGALEQILTSLENKVVISKE